MTTRRIRQLGWNGIVLAGLAAFAFATSADAQPSVPTLYNLGPLTPNSSTSYGMAINAEGSAVAGFGDVQGSNGGFRWTATGGMEPIGGSSAYAISADGSTLAGIAAVDAFRWTAGGGIVPLGRPPGWTFAVGVAISADGTVIAGNGSANLAFRWTASGGTQPTGLSGVNAINADGSQLAGDVFFGLGNYRACRWSVTDGLLELGMLPGGTFSDATAISADGSVMAGYANSSTANARAFRWTATGGMQDLGTLPGRSESFAFGIGADGSAVVGYANTPQASNDHALLWTPALGMVDLNMYLPTLGIDLTGWTLSRAQGLSADGTSIVGYGVFGANGRAWVVRGLNLGFCPSVLIAPKPTTACATGSGMFTVTAAGSGTLTYQWQIETAPGSWMTLGNDPGPLACPGGGAGSAFATPLNSATVIIGVRNCPSATPGGVQHWNVRVLVTNNCGSTASKPTTLTICPADFNCSGTLTVQDIFDYLNAWFAADPRTDVNGGGLAVQDIFDFLSAWFAGCV